MADGKILYQGAADRSASYFKQNGFPFPKYCNPADQFIKLLSLSFPATDEDRARIVKLTAAYDQTKAHKIERDIETFSFPALQDALAIETNRSSFCTQLI